MAYNIRKVVFVGEGNSGKTAYLKRVLEGVFEQRYIPTVGCEIKPVTHNNVHLNIWDTAGVEMFGAFLDGYWVDAEVFVVFLNSGYNNELIRRHTTKWTRTIKLFNPNAKIIYALNKSDIRDISVWFNQTFPDFEWASFSTKSCIGIYDLLDAITEQL